MGNTKDVTDRFRDAVYCAARNEGFSDEKLAKISSYFIMHKSAHRSTFTLTAIEILGNIGAMHAFILAHRKDYTDRHRSTEKDRDNIEHEVGLFVKACRESIDALKNSIGSEKTKTGRPGWLIGSSRDNPNRDLIAHQHGMVLILSEHLHTVTSQFDQLRAGRFQEAIDKRIPKRRRGLQGLEPALGHVTTETVGQGSLVSNKQNLHDGQPEGLQAQQLMDVETRMLQKATQPAINYRCVLAAKTYPWITSQVEIMGVKNSQQVNRVELTNIMDTAQETERKVLEVSALNHLFSTHVLHQAKQIEKLYQQALDATQNVDKGNKELSKAIRRSNSSRLYICLIVIVLSLTLLFLDWYG